MSGHPNSFRALRDEDEWRPEPRNGATFLPIPDPTRPMPRVAVEQPTAPWTPPQPEPLQPLPPHHEPRHRAPGGYQPPSTPPPVHGHHYAVKVPGYDTQPFAAIKPYPPCLCDKCQWAMNVAGGFDGECRCDQCRYEQRPGADAVLYSGPDSVLLSIFAAIRDGRYADIHAEADEAQHAIHASFDAAERRTRRTLAPALRAWQRADEARKRAAVEVPSAFSAGRLATA